jgi:hypothetical protein
MAKLKELRESAPKWMTTSLLDILVELDPTETNKFVPMMMKILEKEHTTRVDKNWSEYDREVFINEINGLLSPSLIDKSDFLHTYSYYKLLSDTFLFQNSTIQDINEFISLFMKKYITNVDVQQIKTWEEITNIVSIANIKFETKEFEKQIVTVFEDEKWLVIRPLTHESSLKYGSSTRWCTASKHSPEHFFRYSESGMLFYCINKINGYKVAIYKSVRERELSFWDSADNRIDSMESELDGYVYDLIRKEITNPEHVPNCNLNVLVYNESFERNLKRKEPKKLRNRITEQEPMDDGPQGRIDNMVGELSQEIAQAIDREIMGEMMSETPNTLNLELEEVTVEMEVRPLRTENRYDNENMEEAVSPQPYDDRPMMAG